MKKYNLFQAIPMSFYSQNLYRDVANNWGASVFLYLFVLLLITWIPLTAEIQHALNTVYKNNADQIAAQVPTVTIKEGIISTPENRPYFILDKDGKERIAVIDTTGQYTTIEAAQTSLLITKDSFITQSKPHETKINTLPKSLNMEIVPTKVNSVIKSFLGYIWIFLFILFVGISFIYRLIQVILYSVIGLLFNSICQSHLSFGQIILVATMAITPPIVLATILSAFGISFSAEWLCYFALAMIYLFFGIRANKSKDVT